MPKRVNVHETSGDGAILVRNYGFDYDFPAKGRAK